MDRRDLLRVLLPLCLVQQVARAGALRGSVGHAVRPWLAPMEGLCADLAAGRLRPAQWQAGLAELLGRVELADLLRAIDFERLAAGARFPAEGEHMERLYFPDTAGRLQPLHFRPFLFSLRPEGAVVPHGHHNLATMHMLLAGRVHARHYDRLEDGATHLVLRAASDEVAGPGHVSTVSDEKDNVHWFRALGAPVFMFNIGVYQVDPARRWGERDYVDPLRGEPLAGGLLRAPRLERREAYARYG